MQSRTNRSARLAADQVFASLTQIAPVSSIPCFGIVKDVSDSGICVHTMQSLSNPGAVRIDVSVGERTFSLTMTVARVEPESNGFTVGLRFRTGDPERASFLREFLRAGRRD